jgi:hypothetical protein
MSIIAFFIPLYFTMAALFLGAIETSLFPNLGIPAILTPDLNLALLTFLASCPFGWRPLLAAAGVSIAAALNNSSPGIIQPGIMLFIFFTGGRLNQTIFMNNIFPQAFFAGCSSMIMTILLGILATPQPPLGSTIMVAGGCALTTALFAFPILSYLNALQEHFRPLNPDSITS